MSSHTPFWTGSTAGSPEVPEARRVARELAPGHPELGYHALFSAAAYVIRDGRSPRERTVLDEARRRERIFEAMFERNLLKRAITPAPWELDR